LRSGLLALAIVAVPFGFGQTVEDFYSDAVLHDIRIYMHPADWQRLRDNFETNTYYPAEFVWRNQSVVNVGVRSRGGGSRTDFKPGLKVDFTRYIKGLRFLGLSSVTLDNHTQDPSFLRERLTMLLFRKAGIAAPRTAYARLFINDRYWGLYSIVEEIEKPFLRANFGQDTGHLYEYNWIADYRFQYLGDDPDLYAPWMFEPKTRETAPDYPTLVEFIRSANETPHEQYLDVVGEFLSWPLFARYLALENYVSEWDGLLGSAGMNNFYLYRFNGSKRFQFIPWDKDVGMTNADYPILENLATNALTAGAFQHPAIVEAYFDELNQMAELAGGAGGWLEQEFDRAYLQIREAVHQDPNKYHDNDDFELHIDVMRDFIRARPLAVQFQVEELRGGQE